MAMSIGVFLIIAIPSVHDYWWSISGRQLRKLMLFYTYKTEGDRIIFPKRGKGLV